MANSPARKPNCASRQGVLCQGEEEEEELGRLVGFRAHILTRQIVPTKEDGVRAHAHILPRLACPPIPPKRILLGLELRVVDCWIERLEFRLGEALVAGVAAGTLVAKLVRDHAQLAALHVRLEGQEPSDRGSAQRRDDEKLWLQVWLRMLEQRARLVFALVGELCIHVLELRIVVGRVRFRGAVPSGIGTPVALCHVVAASSQSSDARGVSGFGLVVSVRWVERAGIGEADLRTGPRRAG